MACLYKVKGNFLVYLLFKYHIVLKNKPWKEI
jgi:hypothetical protein